MTVLTEVAEQLATVLGNAEANEERRRAERDLRSRDAILEAVSHAAEHFLKQPAARRRDERPDARARRGDRRRAAPTCSRTSPATTACRCCFRRAGWSATDELPTIDDPRLGHLAPAPHFPRWAAILGAGRGAQRPRPRAAVDEREALELADTLSVVAVPVVRRGRLVGLHRLRGLRAGARLERGRDRRPPRRGRPRRRRRQPRTRPSATCAVATRSSRPSATQRGRLVAEPSWRDAADDLLERLGDRSRDEPGLPVRVRRSAPTESGSRASASSGSRTGSPPSSTTRSCRTCASTRSGSPRLARSASANELFAGKVRDFPDSERELFDAQDVLVDRVGPDLRRRLLVGLHRLRRLCRGARAGARPSWTRCAPPRACWRPPFAASAPRRCCASTSRSCARSSRPRSTRSSSPTTSAATSTSTRPAASFIGVAKRDLIGRRVDEFLPPQRLERCARPGTSTSHGGPVLEEWETMRPDGTVVVSDASARPNFVPRLHIAFMRDVTERKRLEAELLSAQKLESLGRLAGGVAHDFNNLLTGITGYATLLLERANGDGELRRDLGEIVRAADRAAELTKQLLAFGRRQVLKPRPLDLNAVVAESSRSCSGWSARTSTLEIQRRRRPRHRPRRPRPDRAGDRQSRRERAGRDAGRRPAHDRDPERRRRPRRARLHGHRRRNGRGHRRPDLRAVLHDARAGRRARPRLGLRDRPPEQRRRVRRELARGRHGLHHYPATRV